MFHTSWSARIEGRKPWCLRREKSNLRRQVKTQSTIINGTLCKGGLRKKGLSKCYTGNGGCQEQEIIGGLDRGK